MVATRLVVPQSGKSATAKALARKSASGKAARARCSRVGCTCSRSSPLPPSPALTPSVPAFATPYATHTQRYCPACSSRWRGTRGAFSVCGYGLRYGSTAGVAPVWATVALAFHKIGGVWWWLLSGWVCRLRGGRCASDPPTHCVERGSVWSLRGGFVSHS